MRIKKGYKEMEYWEDSSRIQDAVSCEHRVHDHIPDCGLEVAAERARTARINHTKAGIHMGDFGV
jgi:hypothetical protein